MDETKTDGKNMDALAAQMAQQLQRGAAQGIEKLAAAYVKAWAELDVVVKNAVNPHFKRDYADLTAVLDTIRPVFAKYELALFQAPGKVSIIEGSGGELAVTINGILFHSSGQAININTQLPLGSKPTAQSCGGAITYGRRYQALAVGGIAPVDDDGNAATTAAQSAPPPPKKETKPKAEKPPEKPPEEKKADKPEPKKEAKKEPASDADPTPESLQKLIAAAVKMDPEEGLNALLSIKDAVKKLADQYTANQWIAARNAHKEAQEKAAA